MKIILKRHRNLYCVSSLVFLIFKLGYWSKWMWQLQTYNHKKNIKKAFSDLVEKVYNQNQYTATRLNYWIYLNYSATQLSCIVINKITPHKKWYLIFFSIKYNKFKTYLQNCFHWLPKLYLVILTILQELGLGNQL